MPCDYGKCNRVCKHGLLFAVHAAGANPAAKMIVILAMMFAEPVPAAALTDAQNRAIGCVAFLGVAAAIQRQGVTGYNLTDVQTDGPRWAGIVGAQVVQETGLPREVIGFAIQAAVPGAQRLFQLHNPLSDIAEREAECLPLMRADLAKADALSKPLPIPQRPKGKR